MILRFGEVVLIRMRFHRSTGAKVRPAVVLLDIGDDDFVAAPIISQPRRVEHDVAIEDWQAAGLNVASYAREHPASSYWCEIKLATSISTTCLAAGGNLVALLAGPFA